MKIGFFDSGLGGLTILTAVRKLLPEYEYVYFGDTANLPYGNKTEKEIYALTWNGVQKLFESGAVLVIVACNSASAESVRKIQDNELKEKYPDRKVLGVVIHTIETLIAEGATNALLIGTERTINSKKYERELSHIVLRALATPTLAPLIELHNIEAAYTDACKSIDSAKEGIDTLILGCTHYTVLKDGLRKAYPEMRIISQDEIVPEKLKNYLERHPEIETCVNRTGNIEIMLSAENEHYKKFETDLLNGTGE